MATASPGNSSRIEQVNRRWFTANPIAAAPPRGSVGEASRDIGAALGNGTLIHNHNHHGRNSPKQQNKHSGSSCPRQGGIALRSGGFAQMEYLQ
ncbi:hypothetical protein N658DRAFT_355584 [Parathielavia hyrcaniae]|uniref:Uncharacterized protein n=1 Tax=Parathielavia hyrcaniae TaxID=113614 RepID=A0AAN6Q7K5_9PEZI|nr:hypothetical protein N658DRAFT_355584 [Parathielavia hyrcaniae]